MKVQENVARVVDVTLTDVLGVCQLRPVTTWVSLFCVVVQLYLSSTFSSLAVILSLPSIVNILFYGLVLLFCGRRSSRCV